MRRLLPATALLALHAATAAQAGTWAFDIATPGTSALRAIGTFAAPAPGARAPAVSAPDAARAQ